MSKASIITLRTVIKKSVSLWDGLQNKTRVHFGSFKKNVSFNLSQWPITIAMWSTVLRQHNTESWMVNNELDLPIWSVLNGTFFLLNSAKCEYINLDLIRFNWTLYFQTLWVSRVWITHVCIIVIMLIYYNLLQSITLTSFNQSDHQSVKNLEPEARYHQSDWARSPITEFLVRYLSKSVFLFEIWFVRKICIWKIKYANPSLWTQAGSL